MNKKLETLTIYKKLKRFELDYSKSETMTVNITFNDLLNGNLEFLLIGVNELNNGPNIPTYKIILPYDPNDYRTAIPLYRKIRKINNFEKIPLNYLIYTDWYIFQGNLKLELYYGDKLIGTSYNPMYGLVIEDLPDIKIPYRTWNNFNYEKKDDKVFSKSKYYNENICDICKKCKKKNKPINYFEKIFNFW